MAYRADLSRDIPAGWKPKRIVFYAQGLKIYGLLPYVLKRKLKGEFISNYYVNTSGAFRGAGMIAPTGEANYTVIPYCQKPEHAQMLLNWLYEEKGFEWAIASAQDWNENLREWNAYKEPPSVWVPASNEQNWRQGFQQLLAGDQAALKLLGGNNG